MGQRFNPEVKNIFFFWFKDRYVIRTEKEKIEDTDSEGQDTSHFLHYLRSSMLRFDEILIPLNVIIKLKQMSDVVHHVASHSNRLTSQHHISIPSSLPDLVWQFSTNL